MSNNYKMFGQLKDKLALERQIAVEDKHVQLSIKSKEQADFEHGFLTRKAKDALLQNNLQNVQRLVSNVNEQQALQDIQRRQDKEWVEAIEKAHQAEGHAAKEKKLAEQRYLRETFAK